MIEWITSIPYTSLINTATCALPYLYLALQVPQWKRLQTKGITGAELP